MKILLYTSNFNDLKMRRLVFKSIIITLPVVFILVTVNYIGDAAKLFDSDYEKRMAEIISNEHFVTNISNYDERIFQKELIFSMNASPEIIVFGSSRTMLINSSFFPGKTFFNHSVSGASIEDFIGLYQMYIDRGFKPEKVVIGIDPWIFNEGHGQTRWKSIRHYYQAFKGNSSYEHKSYTTFKYQELFSFSYFQGSLKSLIKNIISGNSTLIPTRDKYNATNTKLIDGSLVYGESDRGASQEVINTKIKNFLIGNIYSIENFDNVSEIIWDEFMELVQELKENDITVEFFLCPYAPSVFQVIENSYPMVLETERRIKRFAEQNQYILYGSFNPLALNFDDTYFYDGMHCKEQGIAIILETEELKEIR